MLCDIPRVPSYQLYVHGYYCDTLYMDSTHISFLKEAYYINIGGFL